MFKSIVSVMAGLVFTAVVTTAVDIVLHVVKVYPPLGEPMTDELAVLATGYRFIISVVGGYLTAWLAPNRPKFHAVFVLGSLGTLLGVLGVIATAGKGLAPEWYAPVIAGLAVPQCWLGAWLFMRLYGPVSLAR